MNLIGQFVIIRTRSAGVHCGILASLVDTVCTLTEARRIWRWRGANSLHELSLHGAAEEWTRISEEAAFIYLPETIEVIPCTEKAKKNLRKSRWSKQ